MANEVQKIIMSETFFNTVRKEDSGSTINKQNVEKSLEDISLFFNNKTPKNN